MKDKKKQNSSSSGTWGHFTFLPYSSLIYLLNFGFWLGEKRA